MPSAVVIFRRLQATAQFHLRRKICPDLFLRLRSGHAFPKRGKENRRSFYWRTCEFFLSSSTLCNYSPLKKRDLAATLASLTNLPFAPHRQIPARLPIVRCHPAPVPRLRSALRIIAKRDRGHRR